MTLTRRRLILGGLAAATLPLVTRVRSLRAAPPPRAVRVGIVTSGIPARWALIENAFAAGLLDHGYVEGRNVELIKRTVAPSDRGRMIESVAAFVERKVDAIATSCGWGTSVSMRATSTIPIVFGGVADPVGRGFVKSLARPGSNVTGVSGRVPDLTSKMLDYLHLALPRANVVAALVNANRAEHRVQLANAEKTGAALGVRIVPIRLDSLQSIEVTIDLFRESGAHAVLALPQDEHFYEVLDTILSACAMLRLATFFPRRDAVDLGGLMSYGADPADLMKRSAGYVDKILNGASAGELPVELATRLEFAVNMKLAGALGITLPRVAMMRVDTAIN